MKSRFLPKSPDMRMARISSPIRVQPQSRIDTRLPLGETRVSQNQAANRPTFSKIPSGAYTIRGGKNDLNSDIASLEMSCLKEQIHVDSYANMIKRIERQIQSLQQQNQSVASSIVDKRQRYAHLEAKFQEEQSRHLTEMNELLNEADLQEQRVTHLLNNRSNVQEDMTPEMVEQLEREVDQMKCQLSKKQKQSLTDFSGLVNFVEFLERSNAQLCKQIESLQQLEHSRHVLICDYQEGASTDSAVP